MVAVVDHACSAGCAISVRQLREEDLETADTILRNAFDAFTGLANLFAKRDYVHTRWHAQHGVALAAELEGALVGSCFATAWGSVSVLGPLSVHPDRWDRGIGKALMAATIDRLAVLGTRQCGLFTFAQSAKHLGLYQRFGFWPQFLTCILSREVSIAGGATGGLRYSTLTDADRENCLRDCAELTNALCDGLDVSSEIKAVHHQKLGDTLLFWNGSRLEAFAVCHAGGGSEAGAGSCYVKFGAARPGPHADRAFERLIAGCESLATMLGALRLNVGVNTACHESYRALLARGYAGGLQGVAMERPNRSAYHRLGAYIIDDWR